MNNIMFHACAGSYDVEINVHDCNDIMQVISTFRIFLSACGFSEDQINGFIKKPRDKNDEK